MEALTDGAARVTQGLRHARFLDTFRDHGQAKLPRERQCRANDRECLGVDIAASMHLEGGSARHLSSGKAWRFGGGKPVDHERRRFATVAAVLFKFALHDYALMSIFD